MRSLNIAATGMQAQQVHVDVISHNLANMTTDAYKRMRPEFHDLIYEDLRRSGATSTQQGNIVPTGIQLGLGVKTGATYRQMGQGTLQPTENDLDIAINGRGFMQIELPTGQFAYSRNGALQLSPNGDVVTSEGFIVAPGLTVPQDAKSVNINRNGVVEAKLDGQVDPVQIGQIELVNFVNERGLSAIGDNLYLETPASGLPIQGFPGDEGFGIVMQRYLEKSNVNPVTEITSLIVAQRSYEMNSKVITASDEMLQALNQSA
jgi:flagellar basal-body rod protein FlgG